MKLRWPTRWPWGPITTEPPTLGAAPDCLDARGRTGRRVLVVADQFGPTWAISLHPPLQHMASRGELDWLGVTEHWGSGTCLSGRARAAWLLDHVRPDFLILTRCCRSWTLALLQLARKRGIPCASHIDDDLLNLPSHLPAGLRRQHARGRIRRTRRRLLAEADLVYCSTVRLGERMRAELGNVALYCGQVTLYVPPGPSLPPRRPEVIGYMGSRGHAADLERIAPAIAAVMEARPELRFETFGTVPLPALLQAFGPRVRERAVIQGYREFLTALTACRWALGLAPLGSDAFNQCKTPTKVLEYTAAGIPILASDVPVYSEVIESGSQGLLIDDSGWTQALKLALDHPELAAAWQRSADAAFRERFRIEAQVHELGGLLERLEAHRLPRPAVGAVRISSAAGP